MCLVRECWTGLHEMAMAAFESQYIDKDTYSASAEDIEVQSCFLDDQLTNLSPPRNLYAPDVLLRKLESSSYHALGACLRPYNAFLRRVRQSNTGRPTNRASGDKWTLRNQFLPFEHIP
ncbi:hypothetical protein Tco_1312478 [Tanacetum coccineum]